jgi:hypothetical protein
MDHPCYKCGQRIDDGKPFCAQCGAPQIRVPISEASPVPSQAGDGLQVLSSDAESSFGGIPGSSLPVRTPQAAPCALAAGAAALLMFVGLNPFVAAIGAGFLSVALFRRRIPGTLTRASAGARLGALGGFFLFGMSTILETLAVVVLHKGAEIRGEMMDKFQQAASRYPGPEVKPFLEFVTSPDGFAIMMLATLLFGLVAFIVLGSLGGALGAAFLGKRDLT